MTKDQINNQILREQMKLLHVILSIVSTVAVSAETYEEGLQRIIKKTSEKPTQENLVRLAEEIRDNFRYQSHLSPFALQLTYEAQYSICQTPGHAEYFGKRIREAYEPLKGPHPGMVISDVQNEMMYSFATLKNLPSPETVKVLGEMLSETWRMKRLPPIPGDYRYTPDSLALSAVGLALMQLPLREPPKMPVVMAWDDPEVVLVHPWQSLWDEIKSGKRTFSFRGQKVEYRFKPDGTWETLAMANPPDDGPKAPAPRSEAARPDKKPPPAPVKPPADSTTTRTGILVSVILLILGISWYIFKRQKNSGAA